MKDLTASFTADIALAELLLALVLSVLFALLLGWVIKQSSRLIGDTTSLATTLLVLLPTMVLVISIVKSSLALSLGLVGALSIVRFRTPIKEPEELVYLFVGIAAGLGLGANQILSTSVAFAFILLVMLAVGHFRNKPNANGLYLDIDGPHQSERKDTSIDALCHTIRDAGIAFELRRYSLDNDALSATLYIEPTDSKQLDDLSHRIRELIPNAGITVLDRSRQLG